MNQDIVLAALSSGFASAILVKLLDILQEWRKHTVEEKLRIQKKKEDADNAYIAEKKAVYYRST